MFCVVANFQSCSSDFNISPMSQLLVTSKLLNLELFSPILSRWVGGWVFGYQENVCLGCISGKVRCSKKLILGRDIGWGGVGVQRHGETLI